MRIVREKDDFFHVRIGLGRKLIYTDALMTAINDFIDGPWEEPEPPHSHPHAQTGYIAEGEVIFYCEGEEDQHLVKGDLFCVPPNIKHTIKCLTPIVRIVDSFTPIRQDFLREEKCQ
ncbi:cupin domain-containing protein [candidate division KSB1 bacterium]|nr:cupin domain-containing protein [candidate division KSB1 bacterium]